MKEIILKHLNEIGTDLEESYGDKLIVLEEKEFEEFAEKLKQMIENGWSCRITKNRL